MGKGSLCLREEARASCDVVILTPYKELGLLLSHWVAMPVWHRYMVGVPKDCIVLHLKESESSHCSSIVTTQEIINDAGKATLLCHLFLEHNCVLSHLLYWFLFQSVTMLRFLPSYSFLILTQGSNSCVLISIPKVVPHPLLYTVVYTMQL